MKVVGNVRKTVLTLMMSTVFIAGSQSLASITYDWRAAEHRVLGDLCDTQDRDFDGFRYKSQIPHCRRNVTVETKRSVAHEFGIFDEYQKYEIDHYIPLSIGGSNEPANLWPLPVPVARAKSALEGRIHQQVIAGELSQEQAIERVRSWKNFINVAE